jgi:hypothetical protein
VQEQAFVALDRHLQMSPENLDLNFPRRKHSIIVKAALAHRNAGRIRLKKVLKRGKVCVRGVLGLVRVEACRVQQLWQLKCRHASELLDKRTHLHAPWLTYICSPRSFSSSCPYQASETEALLDALSRSSNLVGTGACKNNGRDTAAAGPCDLSPELTVAQRRPD